MEMICVNCGGKACEQHHIVPLALGGNDISTNLVWLCSECHGKIHQWGKSRRSTPQWKELQKIGIEKAKAEGRMGRPRIAKPNNWDEVILRWKAGKITAVAAMKELNLTKTTFYRMVKEFQI